MGKAGGFLGEYRMAPSRPPVLVEQHYRVSAVAELVDCSEGHVREQIAAWESGDRSKGLGPSYLVGDKRIIPASAILAWLERHRVA